MGLTPTLHCPDCQVPAGSSGAGGAGFSCWRGPTRQVAPAIVTMRPTLCMCRLILWTSEVTALVDVDAVDLLLAQLPEQSLAGLMDSSAPLDLIPTMPLPTASSWLRTHQW